MKDWRRMKLWQRRRKKREDKGRKNINLFLREIMSEKIHNLNKGQNILVIRELMKNFSITKRNKKNNFSKWKKQSSKHIIQRKKNSSNKMVV